MQDKLLTSQEVAPIPGVSVAFLERDRWAGPQIPFIKVGARTVRYHMSDINAYIESRKHVSSIPR